MANGIFQSILAEQYIKSTKRHIDVVGDKRKHFKEWLTAANNALMKQDFKIARDLYREVLNFIADDPYPDELNLTEEEIYYIKCCYCYSYAMYLKVGKYFCESKDSLDFLDSTLVYLRSTYPHKMIPVYLEIKYSLAIDHWVLLPGQCQALRLNSKKATEYVTNEMFKSLLPNADEMMETESEALYLYHINTQPQGEEDAYDKWRDEQDMARFKKRLRQKDRPMQTEEFQKDIEIQTEKFSSVSKETQTVSYKNSESQVNMDEEYFQTLNEIKSRLNSVQQRCDYTVTIINEKLSGILTKLHDGNRDSGALKENCDKICARYEVEISKLKDTLENVTKLKEQEVEKNSKLQKIMLDLLHDKYTIRKGICDSLLDKSYFMISYLKDLLQFLTPNTIPDKASVLTDIEYWQNQITVFTSYLTKLTETFNVSKTDVINSGSLDLSRSWPDLLIFCREDNIIYNSFKPAIRHIIDSEKKMMLIMNNNPPFGPQFVTNCGPQFVPAPVQLVNVPPQFPSEIKSDNNVPETNSDQQNSAAHTPLSATGTSIYYSDSILQPEKIDIKPDTTSIKHPSPSMHNINSPQKEKVHHYDLCIESEINQTLDQTNNLISSFLANSIKQKINQEQVKVNDNISTPNVLDLDLACSILGPPLANDDYEDQNACDNAVDEEVLFSELNSPSEDSQLNKSSAPLREDLKNMFATPTPTLPENYDLNVMSADEKLFDYIFKNCPDDSEQDIIITLLEVLEQHGGSYVNIPREIILQQVLKRLKLNRNQQIQKMKQMQRVNKKLDESCTICFEVFKTAKIFTLPCHHVYHKHCIKRWLSKGNYCPICRQPCPGNIK